jgi:hypothetical protein
MREGATESGSNLTGFNDLRARVHDGLVASAKANVRREIVAHAKSPPGYEIVEELAKYQSIAAAGLNDELETRTGNGGEVLALEDEMKFDDPVSHQTLTQPPSVLQAVASRERLSIAGEAGVLALAVETAMSVKATNSIEKMLCHELAAAHKLAMKFVAAADNELRGFDRTGHQVRSIEAGRLANVAARLMATFAGAAITLDRLQSNRRGTQPLPTPKIEISWKIREQE